MAQIPSHSIPSRLMPRGRLTLPAAILLLAALLHLSLLGSWRLGWWDRYTFDSTVTRGHRGWDFFALYQAGHNVRSGVSAYESDNEAIDLVVPRHTPFRYLPVTAYTLGAALTLLSPLWAFRLWVAAVETLLLGCAYVSWRLGRDPLHKSLLAAMWLAFTPYYLEIYLGQFTLVQAALVFAMLLASTPILGTRRARGWALDLAWAASILWKQNTGLFAPLLWRARRWRALLIAAGAVLATSAPYFWRYPEGLARFLDNLRAGPPAPALGNLGARQLVYTLAEALWPGLSPAAHQALQWAWMLLVVGVGLWLLLRRGRVEVGLHVALWTTAYVLIYHHVWEHHYVMLLPALAYAFWRTRAPLVLAVWLLVAVWSPYRLIDPRGLAAYHMPLRWTPLEPAWAWVGYHASKALPAAVLWVWLAWRISRCGEAGLEPSPAQWLFHDR